MDNVDWAIGWPEAAPEALHLTGHILPAGASQDNQQLPEHQLVAAILLQALTDAWAGSLEAIEWMDERAPIFGQWLELDPGWMAGWRSFRPPTPETWDPAEFEDLWDAGRGV